jgi:hypothetical protein
MMDADGEVAYPVRAGDNLEFGSCHFLYKPRIKFRARPAASFG